MGLCKCPKKKVTNLFCFEHRVNVCEHCLVANHPKCIVQSYLQWLQDSDYNPNCTLCNRALTDEECGQCVRLICYDVYHWACLNAYAKTLPANTAPAGYTCPSCNTGIFPAENQVSPVVNALREILSQVNWARIGLGLPLIDDTPNEPLAPSRIENQDSSLPGSTLSDRSQIDVQMPPKYEHHSAIGQINTSTPLTSKHSIVNVDDSALFSRTDGLSSNPRKLFDTRVSKTEVLNTSFDHDEDKYKRKSPFTFLSKWFSSRGGPNKKQTGSSMYRKFVVVLIIGLIGFVTLLLFMSRMGRSVTENDPFLDPMANPNIRIQQDHVNNIPG